MKTRSWSSPSPDTQAAPEESPLRANEFVIFSSRHSDRPIKVELIGATKLTLACLREEAPCTVERESGETLFQFNGDVISGSTEFQQFLVTMDHYWVSKA